MIDSNPKVEFSWLTAFLVSLYSLSSWIVVNGLWVELPLLVNTLPEGWSLPAYLAIIIQVANFAPLIYVPLTKLVRVTGHGFCARCLQPPERLTNCIILIIGLLSCILLAQFWKVVLPIGGSGGNLHSVGLLALTLFAAIVDCMSSVTFPAYLTGMSQLYLGALTFGDAFSDLIPSTIAFIQGVGAEPKCINTTINGSWSIVPFYPPSRFTITTFLYLLAVMVAISLIAFIVLDNIPKGLGNAVHLHYEMNTKLEVRNKSTYGHNSKPCVSDQNRDSNVYFENNNQASDSIEFEEKVTISVRRKPRWCTKEYILPLLLIGYISALSNGFLPALQSYSCAAYNALTYHLAVTLSGVTSAVLAVITTFLVNRHTQKQKCKETENNMENELNQSTQSLQQGQLLNNNGDTVAVSNPVSTFEPYLHWIWITVVCNIPAAYVIYLACTSPNPPHLNGFGSPLAVLTWILLRALFTGLRTWIWMHLSQHSNRPMMLRIAGLATQIGATIGAVVSFLLVVHFQMFKSKIPCVI